MKLVLGKDYGGRPFALPADAVTQTFGILAMRGAGKTNTARRLAEQMFEAFLPFVAVDPVGSWWGLRSAGDGKSAGLPIPIFGGRHGDVPLERTAGAMIADLVAEKRLSCVLDLSDLDSEGAKKTFLLDFATRLYKENTHPLHLFLEEADDYIPQKPMRDEAHLLRAWENIVRRGRARGLGMTMITQRSASINKNVLTQVETLIAMRVTSPQDRKAIGAWVEYHGQSDEILESLSGLANGEAWVWSPHWLGSVTRVLFERSATFDSGATPKQRERAATATLADVDLGAIREQMKQTIEQHKANDPAELRRRIAFLENQLREAAKPLKVEQCEPVRAEVPVLREPQLKRVEALAVGFNGKLDALTTALGELRATIKPAFAVESKVVVRKFDAEEVTWRPSVAPCPRPQSAPTSADAPLGKGERTIFAAIHQHGSVTREQLTVLTGYKRSSRDTYLQRLRQAGYTVEDGARIYSTDAGVAAFGPIDTLPTGDALREHWLQRLPTGERKILAEVCKMGPEGYLARERVSELTGYQRSSRDTYLQRLSARRLVICERGCVRAARELFG